MTIEGFRFSNPRERDSAEASDIPMDFTSPGPLCFESNTR